MMKGLVLGVFTNPDTGDLTFTKAAHEFDVFVDGAFTKLANGCGRIPKDLKQRLFYNLHPEYPLISLVDLGDPNLQFDPLDDVDRKNEIVRIAVAGAVKQLVDAGAKHISVEPCNNPESAAEAANLITFCYDELKSMAVRKPFVEITPIFDNKDSEAWQCGLLKASAQNFARRLMETPANLMTPEIFVKNVEQQVKTLPIEVIVRDREWAELNGMGAFLSVAKGSHEKPLFLELHCKTCADKDPIILVGKGITFDSGGLSLKPPANMDKMRADMGGGAVVSASIYAAATLGLPLNIIGFIPLCENMPGGSATKPGDVVYAMNGKSIQIDNTDAEGRLILADALAYASSFNPALIIDIATLTGAMQIALGPSATGVFTNAPDIYKILNEAGRVTGDRVWQMPLYQEYTKRVTRCRLADLNNIGDNSSKGGACLAAAFLKEFVGKCKWMHLDIAGVMENDGEVEYLPKGMAGRPTRTIVEFLKMISNQNDVLTADKNLI